MVSADGIQTDPSNIEAVSNWPIPKNTKFLGFIGYYRRFVKGYASIVRPLNDLLVGHTTNPGGKRKSSDKATPLRWDAEQQRSFDTIKERLTNPPVLGYEAY